MCQLAVTAANGGMDGIREAVAVSEPRPADGGSQPFSGHPGGQFDTQAGLYDRARPGYPPAAIAWALPHPVGRLQDVGAGRRPVRHVPPRGVTGVLVRGRSGSWRPPVGLGCGRCAARRLRTP